MLHEELAEEVLCSLGGVLYLDLVETSALHSRLAEISRHVAACPRQEAADVVAELVDVTQAVAAHARHTRQLLGILTDAPVVLHKPWQGDEGSGPVTSG